MIQVFKAGQFSKTSRSIGWCAVAGRCLRLIMVMVAVGSLVVTAATVQAFVAQDPQVEKPPEKPAGSESEPAVKNTKQSGDPPAEGKTAEGKTAAADKQSDQGWPVFRGTPGSTGVANTTLPDKLEVLWQFKVPQGAFEGTPVIGRASIDAPPTVYIGDMDGMLFSLDLKTGEKNWEYKTPIGFAASPAYRDGLVFIGDIDGFFYCVDDKGELKWKFETDGEISSSANFYDGHVLFGSQDTRLYLLDRNTGTAIWKHETPDQIRCSATVAGDRAFVAGCDAFFHVIDLTNGNEVGKVNVKSPTGSTPAVLGERVFFGTEQAEFLAINWKTVAGLWAFTDEQGQASVRGCAAVNKDHVIFGARNRQVYSLNPQTGEQQWAVTLKAKVDSSPTIVGDRVYVGSTDGRLYVLELETGKIVWEKQFNGGFLSSPAAAYGKLIIATDRGVVYCLGEPPT